MDKFINAVIERDVDINWLRQVYRGCDVILVDGNQALVGKTATTDFFLNTFNSLKQERKQIIITSDRSPKMLDINERLISRLKSGMLADIQAPSYEERLAILHQYTETLEAEILPEALAYIAENSDGSIREMQGITTRVGALAKLHHQDAVGLGFVKKATQELFSVIADKSVSIDTQAEMIEELRVENRLLKHMVADLSLDKVMLEASLRAADH